MKFLCDKQILQEAINVVQRAVSTKSTMPVLECILIETGDNSITLTGNDLEIGIQYKVMAQILNHGSTVVNAKIFGDIVRKLPDMPVYFEVGNNEGNVANIKCQHAEFDLVCLSAEEYPRITEVSRDKYFSIDEKKLKKMISQTIFAVSTNETRPILTGLLFEIKDKIFTMVALDMYRLSMCKEQLFDNIEDLKTVIPGKTLSEIMKIAKEDNNRVNVFITEKHVLFEFENFIVTTRVLDGEYVNYERTIDRPFSMEIEIEVNQLSDSVERAALIINTEIVKERLKLCPLKMTIDGEQMIINSATQIGKVMEVIDISPGGNELIIGFNYKYLLDALHGCSCDKVKMVFNDAISPCIIKPLEGNEFLHMVLPVRLQA